MKKIGMILAVMLVLLSIPVLALNWDAPYWKGASDPNTINFGQSATAATNTFTSLDWYVSFKAELRTASGVYIKTLAQKNVDLTTYNGYEEVTVKQSDYTNPGTYKVKMIIQDSTGTYEKVLTLKVLAPPNKKPSITCPGSQTKDEGQPVSFPVTAKDDDSGDTVTLTGTGTPLSKGATFNQVSGNPVSQTFSWTPGYDDASGYSMTFTAKDNHGESVTCTVPITINNKNRCPSFNSITDPQEILAGNELKFTVSATDPDGTTPTYGYDNTATPFQHGATFDSTTGEFKWQTSEGQEGDYTVTFYAYDGECTLTISKQITIKVTPRNKPVATLQVSPASGQEGTTFSFTCTGTGGDAPLDYEIDFDDGPTVKAQSATHQYKYAGTYNPKCTVTDADKDSDTDTVTLNVANNVPQVTLVATPTSGEAPLEVDFNCQVSGGNWPMKSYMFDFGDGPPQTLSTGQVKHTYQTKGAYVATCTVKDADDDLASDTVGISVSQNTCPVWGTLNDQTVQAGQNLNFTLTTSDAEGNTITYSADVPFNQYLTSDGKFSWTPAALQVGNHKVTFYADDGLCKINKTINITVTPEPPKPQCSDNVDNDGDGNTDFPADKGCSDANDNDESETPACFATVQFNNSHGIVYTKEMGSADNKVKTSAGKQVHFKEAASSTDYNIALGDLLVMSHGDVTRVLRFDGVDTGNTLVQLTDIGTSGQINSVYSGALNSGDINVGGYSFGFSVDPVGKKLAVDLNDDGNINGGSSVITSCKAGSCSVLVMDLSCSYECNDGLDNDADLLKDLADPGCDSLTDNNETDTVLPPTNQQPVADFTWTPLDPEVGQTVSFISTSTDPDGDTLTCEWDFDADGTADASGCTPVHTFKTPGQHPVTLNVSDGSLWDIVMKQVNVTGRLNVTGISCFDPVVEKHFQSCSVSVEGSNSLAVPGASVKLYYLNGTLLDNCLTDAITGDCAVTFPSGVPGVYTVYATAEKSGWQPDLDKNPTDTFEVFTTKYDITNLAIYNDSAFQNEDYDFYRYEYMYIRFMVTDLTTGQPTNNVVTSVALQSPPGGVAWFTKFPWNNPQTGEYHYVLRIPKTHDFLGLSRVYTFAFNFTDKSGAQHRTQVTIRNNPPVIDSNVMNEFNSAFDQEMSLSLTPYESDVEDSGSNLTWTVMGVDNSIVNVQINADDTMTVTPVSKGFDVVTLMLWDLDGDTDTIDVPIQTMGNVTLPQCADGLDNDNDTLVDMNDPGCSNLTDNNESDDPVVLPQCNDGLDNDNDTLVDMNDPGCSSLTDDDESDDPVVLPQCNDGLDNDNDTLIDMNDPGCSSPADDDETDQGALPQCNDNVDNDADGLIDFPADPGCSSATDNNETDIVVPPQCNDGVDNDNDGLIDWPLDPGCMNASDDNELDPFQCNDGLDNDNDGLIDWPLDPGCTSINDNDETDPVTPPQCSDNVDNDGDGKIDMLDPGCANPQDNDETDPVAPPQCSDNVDNDGDGLIDMLDPGCTSPGDNNETDPVVQPQCNDGLDNDNDGKIDMSDPGCSSLTDNDESDDPVVLPQCSDGLDNDNDGKIDFPADPGCSNALDDDETDVAGNQPPVADVVLSRTYGAPGVIVTVDGSKSYDPDGNITSHVWLITGPANYTFTSSGTGKPGSFGVQFNTVGVYSVRLTVADNNGATDVETKLMTVSTSISQCDDGIDNDGDGKTDFPADPHCSGKDDPQEGEMFVPAPVRPWRDQDVLLVTRIDVNGYDVEGYAVSPGEYLRLSFGLQNNQKSTLEDIKVDASIQELGIRDSDLLRDLDPGDSATVVFNLDIPEYAQPGLYDVRFVVSNDDVRRVKYRTIVIA
jgi:PKD repeat protein